MGRRSGQRGGGSGGGDPRVQGSCTRALKVHLRKDEACRHNDSWRKQEAEWGPITGNQSGKFAI